MKTLFKKIAIGSIFLLNSFMLFAQKQTGFIKIYGEGSSNDILQTSDTGYLLVGGNSKGTYLVKTSSKGDTLWTKNFSDNGQPYRIKKTRDGNYVLAGQIFISSQNDDDAYILKIDSMGNIIWSKNYGGIYEDKAWHIDVTAGDEYIVSGKTVSNEKGWDAYLLKLKSNGDTLWTRAYGTLYDEFGMASILPDSGYLIVTSPYTGAGNNPWQINLIKANSQGDSLWSKTYKRNVNCMNILKTNDGNCIIIGDSSYGVRTYLLKVDTAGNMLWEGFYGKSSTAVRGIVQSKDGGYAVCGWTSNPYNTTKDDVSLIKVDSSGKFLWEREYGWEKSDELSYGIQKTLDGGFAIAGYSFGGSPIPTSKALVIKTDSLGCVYYPGAFFTADTQQIKEGDTIHFTDTSKIITDIAAGYTDSIVSRQWYFGDGDTSTLQSPIHQYKDSGSYTVKLVVTNISGCSDSAVKKGYIVVKKPVGIEEFEVQSLRFKVYPNPTSGMLTVQANVECRMQNLEFRIYDLLGRSVLLSPLTTHHSPIDISSLQNGMYFYQVGTDTEVLQRGKLIIEK